MRRRNMRILTRNSFPFIVASPLPQVLLLTLVAGSPACAPQDAAESPKQETAQESEAQSDLQREAEFEAEMARLRAMAEEQEKREHQLLEAQRLAEEERVSREAATRQAISVATRSAQQRIPQEDSEEAAVTEGTVQATAKPTSSDDYYKSQAEHEKQYAQNRQEYQAALTLQEQLAVQLRICRTPTTKTTTSQGTEHWQTFGSATSDTGEHVTGQTTGSGTSTSTSTTSTYDPKQCLPVVDGLQQVKLDLQRVQQKCAANFGRLACGHARHICWR